MPPARDGCHLFPSVLTAVSVLQDTDQPKRLPSIVAGQVRFLAGSTYDVEGDHPSPPLPHKKHRKRPLACANVGRGPLSYPAIDVVTERRRRQARACTPPASRSAARSGSRVGSTPRGTHSG